jgi:hypothetical protein
MNQKARFCTALAAVLSVSCAGAKSGGIEETPPPPDDASVQDAPGGGEPAQPAGPAAAPEPPPISDCIDWDPKKLLEETGELLKAVQDKSVADMKSVKCFEKDLSKKKKIFLDCDIHECHAWLEYWQEAGSELYKQLDMDGSLTHLLKAAKLVKECRVGGRAAADVYLRLGIVLIDGYGEIMKGSLAFRWAILYDWDVELPGSPAPNVKKTFDVVKQGLGTEPFSCVEE